MGIYILKRLLAAIPTLLIAALLVFSFIHLIPGEPAAVMLGDMASVEDIAALRAQMGLDRPLWEQFFLWLGNAVQGDLGTSIYFQEPVLSVIGEGAETSLFLALLTMLLIVLISIPAGIISAKKHGTPVDQTLSGLTMLFASIPTFWLGLYLIFTVSVGLRLLPTSGFPSVLESGDLSNLRYLILPAITLAAPNSALVIRLVRAGMMDTMREDYVRTARAKGLGEWAVTIKHVFRNALIGVVATLGFTFVGLVSEAVVTETVFALPGIGRLVVQSILRRDYPVIQGVILVVMVFYILVNLLVDIVTTYLDPRVKAQ
ncbi:MAG: ABC transporter permease [Candidatus Competibacteraceae bacterium]|nr:ABC transporter permease [Candidatus Competibacteraceae bacterium]MCB1813349.1 ABC transporter permease [Candidatus Competibacteraceae bacterium]